MAVIQDLTEQTSVPTEVRPLRSGVQYDAPEMFPMARMLRGDELHEYVQKVMVELAKDGKLRATDLLNQPTRLIDIAGRVLLGERIVDHQQRIDRYNVPPELASYRVKLRALEVLDDEGKPTGKHYDIRWKKGMEPVKTRNFARASIKGQSNLKLYEDVWLRVDGREAILPLPLAFLALKQYGKNCRKETKIERQRKTWWYEEVMDDDRPAARTKK